MNYILVLVSLQNPVRSLHFQPVLIVHDLLKSLNLLLKAIMKFAQMIVLVRTSPLKNEFYNIFGIFGKIF